MHEATWNIKRRSHRADHCFAAGISTKIVAGFEEYIDYTAHEWQYQMYSVASKYCSLCRTVFRLLKDLAL